MTTAGRDLVGTGAAIHGVPATVGAAAMAGTAGAVQAGMAAAVTAAAKAAADIDRFNWNADSSARERRRRHQLRR
jgi:hypothetical protein